MSMTKKDTERKLLKEALQHFEKIGCQFWACTGPDYYEDMRTCHACYMIRKLRDYLKENNAKNKKKS